MTENSLILSGDNVLEILLRFLINLVLIIALIRIIYFRYTKKEKSRITFFLKGMVVLPLKGILIINVIILISAFVLGKILFINMFMKQSLVYDKLELLKPGNQNKLSKDVTARTGRTIIRIVR
jgi:hypothetical protein